MTIRFLVGILVIIFLTSPINTVKINVDHDANTVQQDRPLPETTSNTSPSAQPYINWDPQPTADPNAVVISGKARFTVLTNWVIRLEYSDAKVFRDLSTFIVLNRKLSVPKFTSSTSDNVLTIKTSALTLTYRVNSGPFTKDNLAITLNQPVASKNVVWKMDSDPSGNLGGAIRTLDGVGCGNNNMPTLNCPSYSKADLINNHCSFGVISKDGWAVIDDTLSPSWDNSDWPWFTSWLPNNQTCSTPHDLKVDCKIDDQPGCLAAGCCYSPNAPAGIPWCFLPEVSFPYQDSYFFGHGRNFVQAMADFVAITGPIAVLPRYIFGPQYSRYRAFNENDQRTIVNVNYEQSNVPLDVLVIDMDWHYTYDKGMPCNANDKSMVGWTGYTWDKSLFPDPTEFLTWLHEKGLHVTLNMHPFGGVQCFEEKYREFATAMGGDPNSAVTYHYDPRSKKYFTNLFNIILNPLGNTNGLANGNDYWWIDYQQGEALIAPGVNPTFWVNYVFSTVKSQWGANTRPLIMARWGGLGSHRYSNAGFSGDTCTSWTVLAYQPYFTVTGTNVGFFWSHDLGGHMGNPDGQLYVRWIQWGAFSNQLRTHCNSKGPGSYDRDIWMYDYPHYKLLREAFLLRSKLVPYTYTQHFLGYTTGMGLLKPMYMLFSNEQDAFNVPSQYMFGNDMFVSPVVAPGDKYEIATQKVWVPPGVWKDYLTGGTVSGPGFIQRTYHISEIPVFAKAGAIIPSRSSLDMVMLGSAQQIPDVLLFDIFVSKSSESSAASVIEDDGTTTNYQKGEVAITNVKMVNNDKSVTLTVLPVSGKGFASMKLTRRYQLNFKGVLPASTVLVNNNAVPFVKDPVVFTKDFWTYDAKHLAVMVNIATPQSVNSSLVASLSFAQPISASDILVNGIARKVNRAQLCKDALDNEWGVGGTYFPASDYPALLDITNFKLPFNVDVITQKLANFDATYKSAVQQITAITAHTDEQTYCLSLLNSA